MLNETLENLSKEFNDVKTIKSYLINRIAFYDYLIYVEKQKIIKSNNLKADEIKNITDKFNYYTNCYNLYVNLLSDLVNRNIRIFE
jgi:hypothetical protein